MKREREKLTSNCGERNENTQPKMFNLAMDSKLN